MIDPQENRIPQPMIAPASPPRDPRHPVPPPMITPVGPGAISAALPTSPESLPMIGTAQQTLHEQQLAAGYTERWWENGLDWIQSSEVASASLASTLLWGEDPVSAFQRHTTYQDIIDRLLPDQPQWVRRSLGFAAGVGLDPLTYVGFFGLVKGGEVGERALLTFRGFMAHQGIRALPKELDVAAMGGINSARKAFMQTLLGRGLSATFDAAHDAKQLGYVALRSKWLINQSTKIFEGEAKLKEIAKFVETSGLTDEEKTGVRRYMETLGRNTDEDYGAAKQNVEKFMGPHAAEYYRMASAMFNYSQSEYINHGLLTLKRANAMLKENEVLGYLPHVLNKAEWNPIAYIKKRIAQREIADAIQNNPALSEPMEKLAADLLDVAMKKSSGKGIIKDLFPGGLKGRKIPGLVDDINGLMKARKNMNDFLQTDLQVLLGHNMKEMSRATAGVEYFQDLKKALGVEVPLVEEEFQQGERTFKRLVPDHIPPGFTTFEAKHDPAGVFTDYGAKTITLVPKGLERELMSVYRANMQLDKVSTGIIAALDWGTDYFRTTTLHQFMGYHIRNFVGNIYLNFVAGDVTPGDYMHSGKLLWKYAYRPSTLAPEELAAIKEMSVLRVINSGMTLGETGGEGGMGFIESVHAGNWYPWSTKSKLTTAGQWIGNWNENFARAAHFISRRRLGYSAEEAALSTKKFLFDYTKEGLTDFENNILRRVLPFYRWAKNNIPLEMRMIVENPGRISALHKMTQMVEYQTGPQPQEKWMSEWMKANDPVHIKYDQATGKHLYAFLGGWLPLDDLAKLDSPVADMISMVNPWLKEPVQQYMNWDYYFQGKITALPEYYGPTGGEETNFLGMLLNRRYVHLAANVRALSELDRLNPFGIFGENRQHHTDAGDFERWMRSATGMRLYPYDERKSKMLWLNTAKRKIADMKGLIHLARRKGYTKEAAQYREYLQQYMRDTRGTIQEAPVGVDVPAY